MNTTTFILQSKIHTSPALIPIQVGATPFQAGHKLIALLAYSLSVPPNANENSTMRHPSAYQQIDSIPGGGHMSNHLAPSKRTGRKRLAKREKSKHLKDFQFQFSKREHRELFSRHSAPSSDGSP